MPEAHDEAFEKLAWANLGKAQQPKQTNSRTDFAKRSFKDDAYVSTVLIAISKRGTIQEHSCQEPRMKKRKKKKEESRKSLNVVDNVLQVIRDI